MSNRRIWPRVSGQAPVTGGYTLNLSLRGARIVTRQPMKSSVRLRMDLGEIIEIDAEPMWQQELGPNNRVVGLRFKPDSHQEAVLAAWMQRQAS
ncbi:PilZ domain-containing protein [bacterium]|nr:PilZ domain-containing protein [bacterium]